MIVLLLLLSVSVCARCHCYHHYSHQRESKFNKNRIIKAVRNLKLVEMDRYLSVDGIKNRRLEQMLEKAILKIITGELSKANMQLLKSFNYSLGEILEIRERERGTKKDKEARKVDQIVFFQDLPHKNENNMQNWSSLLNDTFSVSRKSVLKNMHINESREKELEEYNKQAVYDYENMVGKVEYEQSELDQSFEDKPTQDNSDQSTNTRSIYQNLNKGMDPYVIFKIRYDDPEFDLMSEESPASLFMTNLSETFQNKGNSKVKIYRNNSIASKSLYDSFHGYNFSLDSLCSLSPHTNFLKVVNNNRQENIHSAVIFTDAILNEQDTSITDIMSVFFNYPDINNFSEKYMTNASITIHQILDIQTPNNTRKNGHGVLEWIKNNIYRVISETTDLVTVIDNYYNNTNSYSRKKSMCPLNPNSSLKSNDGRETKKDASNYLSWKSNATLFKL